jgi:magnesium-transporting ATPase (P-type)
MVEYAFCDKTGTLTSNEMRLRLLVLDGELYGRPSFELEHCGLPPHAALRAFDARLAAALLDSGGGEEAAAAAASSGSCSAAAAAAGESSHDDAGKDASSSEVASSLQCAAVEAFTALAVCHTLIVEERSNGAAAKPKPAADESSASTSSSSSPPSTCAGAAAESPPGAAAPPADVVYQGPSPDEVALVDACRSLGVRFHARSASDVVVDFLGVPLSFEVLAVLEFSSERQRMSVVVRRPDGRVTLFCKGADAALLPLLASPRGEREADVRARTEEHLHELSVLVRARVAALPRCCTVQRGARARVLFTDET